MNARVDQDAAVQVKTPASERKKRRRKNILRFILLIVIPLVLILLAIAWYLQGGRYISTENAYIKSNIVAISSDISGRALDVNIRDNQAVLKGDVMFSIDSESLELQLLETRAQMDVVRSEVESLRAEHQEAVVSVSEARDLVSYLRRQLKRQESLKQKGVGSAQTYDEALFDLKAARQRVNVLNGAVQRTLASFGGDIELAVEKHPSYLQATARYEQALADIARTVVTAPANGIVSNVSLQSGEYVTAGNPLFSLIEIEQLWVEANLKETQLTHVKEGQSAILEIDAYPGIEWKAVVSSIAPATGAEFTLLPPQNATGNWVKVVQRVPVNLTIESVENTPVLRTGMTVSVKIDTEFKRSLL